MSNPTPSPETVLRRALESAMRRMNTAEPGVVEAYNPTTCTVDVQPLVMRVRVDEGGERIAEKAPVVTDVPAYFVGGGGMRLTFPIKKGDQCLLIASSQPLDQWHSTGTLVDPKTTRHHHISDSIALVGLTPAYRATAAHATATVLEGSDIRLGDSSAVAIAKNADLSTLVNVLKTWTVAPADGGAALKAAVIAAFPSLPAGTTKTKAT